MDDNFREQDLVQIGVPWMPARALFSLIGRLVYEGLPQEFAQFAPLSCMAASSTCTEETSCRTMLHDAYHRARYCVDGADYRLLQTWAQMGHFMACSYLDLHCAKVISHAGSVNTATPMAYQAAAIVQAAADRGCPFAQHLFGTLLHAGHGVAQNAQEAARQYKLAAGSGIAEAQYARGVCHLRGVGVTRTS